MKSVTLFLMKLTAAFMVSMLLTVSLHGQLLNPGNAVVSCLPGDDDVTVAILDISQLGMLYMNPANHNVDQSGNVTPGKKFTAADFEGNWIFSTAIDERDGSVYAATGAIYSGTASTPSAIGQRPVAPIIYKIDANTCNITRLVTLPDSLGIGYISVDSTHNVIYATNMDNGIIYSVDLTTGAIVDTWDFGGVDATGTFEFPAIGDRVLGVDYNYSDNRVYYSVWTDNRFEGSGVNNVVRSIEVDAAGNFIPGTDQLEITLPLATGVGYTQPVGDIEFNDAGDKVLLAESPFVTNISSSDTTIAPSSHDARLTGWMNVGGTWTQCPSSPGNTQGTFDVGNQSTYDGLNSRGGAAWAYKTVDGCSFGGDEDFIVTTGDFLKDITIYGFQYSPATGGNHTNSILVDGDFQQGQSKYVYADIDVYTPKPVYDVELNKTVSTTAANLGDVVTYTVEVFNNSCDTVHNVTVLDTLPSGAVYSAHGPAGTIYDPVTGIWNVGDIPQGETVTLTIDVTLTTGGSFYNLAEVNGMDELDEDSTPNNGDLFEDDIAAACVSVPLLLPCDGAAITVNAAPGYGGYVWFLDGAVIPGESGQSISVTAAGSYTYEATLNGCTITTCCSIDVENQTCCEEFDPVATEDEVCYDGTANIGITSVPTATAPLTYLWSTGATTANITVSNLVSDSIFFVTITDAEDCIGYDTLTVLVNAQLTCIAAETVAPACGISNGEATVAPTGGTGPYSYLWDDAAAQTGATATGLPAGTYTVVVTDAKDCTTSCSVTLTDMAGPTCVAGQIMAPTCGASNGSATVTVTGGLSPYTYSWNDAGSQATVTASDLPAGTYIVVVTDSNNCTTECSVTITDIGGPTCTAAETAAPTCGASNGEATVSPADGTGPYTYLWDDAAAQTGATATGLAAGTYNVEVTDSNNCTTSCSVTLTDAGGPTCTTTVGAPPTCGASNGEATVTPAGGTGPFTYLWDDAAAQTGATATGLAAGTYNIEVTDANNCTTSCSVTLTDAGGPSCTATETVAPTCGASNGEATVAPAGGTAPYTYLWDDGAAQTTATATGLAAGTYNIEVTDANNCTTSCSVTLTDEGGPTCVAGVIVSPTCGASNGEASVTVTGGLNPYTYLWDDPGAQTGVTASGLAAGTYIIEVTDANNCTTTCSVTLTDTGGPTCTAAQTVSPTCGASNGEATVTPAGGTGPYTYLWDDAAAQTGATATGLAAGTYNVEVTDANNCTTSCSATLTDTGGPTCTAAQTAAPTCGASNGEATVTPADGAGPYTYLWDDAGAQTGATATGLAAGTYNVEVTDANNCTTSCSVTLTDIGGPTCTVQEDQAPTCGNSDGSITVIPSGGTAPFTYLWNDASGQTTPIASGLPAGTYSVAVTDANNCQTSCDITISEVNCSYDLALVKTVNTTATPGPYNQGSLVTFTIEVFNQGTLDAANVEVTDYIPAGFTFSSSSDFSATAPHIATIASIPAGQSETIEITLQIDANFQGTSITNNAEITGDDGDDVDSTPGSEDGSTPDPNDDDTSDTNGGDDYDPETINVNQVYDLALVKQIDATATPGPYGPGSLVTFVIEVFNQGTVDANNVEVTDYIPADMSFDSSTDFSGTAPHTATIANIPAGQSTIVSITLQINNTFMGDAITNNAEITGDDGDDVDSTTGSEDGSTPDANDDDTADTNGGDDYDPAVVSVLQEYDLALVKSINSTATPGPYSPGSLVTFTIDVINQGTLDATNVEVTDYIPTDMSFDSSSDFSATAPHTATIASIPAGQTVSVELTLKIDDNYMGTSIVNNAEITADDGDDVDSAPGSEDGSTPDANDDDTADTNGGDDYDPATVPVVQVYDLALIKTLNSGATPGPFEQGSLVAYTIEVFNQGTLDANNIEVTDYIPAGMSFESSADFSASAPHTATIASLPAGQSTTVEIVLRIDAGFMGTSLINNAEITGDDGDDVDSTPGSENGSNPDPNDDDVSDTNGGDDYDPTSIEVIQIYDLALIKELNASATPGPFIPGDDVAFTITVFNQGTLDANNVEVTDYLPSDMSLSTNDSNGWAVSANGIVNTIAAVPAGSSATIDVTLTIDPGYTGLGLTNWAEISNDDGDDVDSTPDGDNFNTAGETDDLDDDNVSDNSNGDEDDHDPVFFEVLQGAIGDIVWKDFDGDSQQDPNEPGVPNITMILQDCNGVEISRTTTDSNGNYLFDHLPPGDYQVQVDLATIDADCILIPANQGGDSSLDSDFSLAGNSGCVTLNTGDRNTDIDLGLLPLSSLGDFVWHDLNGNGVQDDGEPFLGGVGVDLFDINGDLISSVTTDANGQYIFDQLLPGNYYVEFTPPPGFTITQPNSGNDNNADSNLDNSNGINTSSFTNLSPGEHDPSWDAGFYMCAKLGDLVFYDLNENDQFDSSENGLNGLIVTLFRKYGDQWVEYDDEVTGNNPNGASDDGYFKFCVPPGSYYLSINVPPIDLVPVIPGQGDEENDSDLTGAFGMHTTDEIVLLSGEERCDVGLGYYPMASFGDIVWLDDNADGVRQNHESGAAGVLVEAYDIQNNVINSTTTNSAGNYRLNNLQKEDYYLKFHPPSGYSFASSNSTLNDAVDSDVDHSNGHNTTGVYNMAPGVHMPNVDAGLVVGAALPVDLVSFTGQYRSDYVVLSWETASEINTDLFQVERRHNSEDDFSAIARQVANGNAHKYSLNDYEVAKSGTYYYRLRIIDNDGSEEFSDVISVEIGRSQEGITLYPNPSLDIVNLELSFKAAKQVSVDIYDVEGRLVRKSIINNTIDKGTSLLELDLENLNSGVYNVKVIIDQQIYNKKLIKLEN